MRLLAGSIVFVTLACGTQGIDLTRAPSDPEAGTVELRCSSSADCPSGSYCEKTTCGDAMGTCELLPAECPDDDAPVCGCDRITYFNDCLRQANGVATARPGPCKISDGTQCGGSMNTPCPDGTLCALFAIPGFCKDPIGSCWALPAACPPKSKTKPEWDSCYSLLHCVDTCTAIKTGGPYHYAGNCN